MKSSRLNGSLREPAAGSILGVVEGVDLLEVVLGQVHQGDLQGPEHRHAALGAHVEVLADGMLQDGHLGVALVFGHADLRLFFVASCNANVSIAGVALSAIL